MILRDEYGFTVFENRMLRRILILKGNAMTRG
jgi:hypothetical protein